MPAELISDMPSIKSYSVSRAALSNKKQEADEREENGERAVKVVNLFEYEKQKAREKVK